MKKFSRRSRDEYSNSSSTIFWENPMRFFTHFYEFFFFFISKSGISSPPPRDSVLKLKKVFFWNKDNLEWDLSSSEEKWRRKRESKEVHSSTKLLVSWRVCELRRPEVSLGIRASLTRGDGGDGGGFWEISSRREIFRISKTIRWRKIYFPSSVFNFLNNKKPLNSNWCLRF